VPLGICIREDPALRSVRKPLKGSTTNERFSQLEDIEFVFPKEYNKILSPVFSQDFDFEAKSENGVLKFILTPASKAPKIDNVE
jgi:hypothetical protein